MSSMSPEVRPIPKSTGLRGLIVPIALTIRDVIAALVKLPWQFVLFWFRYLGSLPIIVWSLCVFKVLNSTTVHGKRFISPWRRSVLYVSRHQTLIETIGIPTLLFFP